MFTDEPVVDDRSLVKSDAARGRAFTTALIKRGVVKNGQKMYVSLVHTAEDVARTLEACADALRSIGASAGR